MMILSLIIILILILVLFLYNKDFFHRNVVITVVTNLPLGIFKDENNIKKEKQEEKAEEKEINKVPAVELKNNEQLLEKVESNESIEFSKEKEIIVYWTPNGKSYHTKNNCMTLSRSKKILTGTLSECEKEICCEHCKIKED